MADESKHVVDCKGVRKTYEELSATASISKEVRQDCIGWSRGVVTHSSSCLYLAQMFCFADDSATIRLSCAS